MYPKKMDEGEGDVKYGCRRNRGKLNVTSGLELTRKVPPINWVTCLLEASFGVPNLQTFLGPPSHDHPTGIFVGSPLHSCIAGRLEIEDYARPFCKDT